MNIFRQGGRERGRNGGEERRRGLDRVEERTRSLGLPGGGSLRRGSSLARPLVQLAAEPGAGLSERGQMGGGRAVTMTCSDHKGQCVLDKYS